MITNYQLSQGDAFGAGLPITNYFVRWILKGLRRKVRGDL